MQLIYFMFQVQQEKVDRIEDNIENAQVNVKEASLQLSTV